MEMFLLIKSREAKAIYYKEISGRSSGIQTHDLTHPKGAR